MAGDFLDNKVCAYCGNPAKRVNFARILCDNDECLHKAMDDRGGPGGHRKKE